MEREGLTTRSAVAINVLVIFGSTAVMGVSSATAQDSWMTLLLAVILAVPAVLVYARLQVLLPGKQFFEMAEDLLGVVGGKIVSALMIWYTIHLGSLVMRNFSEFIGICVLPETPQLAVILSMTLVVCYMVKSGLDIFAKWSSVALPVVVIIVVLTILLAVNRMELDRILPVGVHDWTTIASEGYKLFTFPFAEVVVFLCVAPKSKKGGSPYKVFLLSILFGGVLLMAILLRNVLLLGPAVMAAEYFPSYTAAKVINLGELVSRLEGSIAMNFILAGIVKLSLCIFAASKGLAKLLDVRDYRGFVFPAGLLCAALCTIIYRGIAEMMDFISVYQYYAIPFQLVFPVGLWVIAEVRRRRERIDEARASRCSEEN